MKQVKIIAETYISFDNLLSEQNILVCYLNNYFFHL